MEYTQNNGEAYVSRIPFSGGYIEAVKTSSAIQYLPRYWFTDHLGSVRSIVNQTGVIIEANDFTPFGKRWEVASRPKSSNRYLFNGKQELTCGYLDYGARLYDPEIGRWIQPDPLADSKPSINPYVYCLNNPMKYVDPNGLYEYIIVGGSMLRSYSNANDPWGPDHMVIRYGHYDRNLGGIRDDGLLYSGATVYTNHLSHSAENIWGDDDFSGGGGGAGSIGGSGGQGGANASPDPMMVAIHQAQIDFWKGTADFAGYVVQKSGTYITWIGLASAPIDGIGFPLITIGNYMTVIGSGIRVGINYSNGNKNQAIFEASSTLIFGFLPELVKPYMNPMQNVIFSSILQPYSLVYGEIGNRIDN